MGLMEFLNKYWSQIVVVIGAIGALLSFYFKRKQFAYESLNSNRIGETKLFLQSLYKYSAYFKDYTFLQKYPNQTKLSAIEEKIRESFAEFESQAAITKLFFDYKERSSIDSILSEFQLAHAKMLLLESDNPAVNTAPDPQKEIDIISRNLFRQIRENLAVISTKLQEDLEVKYSSQKGFWKKMFG